MISYNYPGYPYLGVPWFTVTGVLIGIWLGWLLATGWLVKTDRPRRALGAQAG